MGPKDTCPLIGMLKCCHWSLRVNPVSRLRLSIRHFDCHLTNWGCLTPAPAEMVVTRIFVNHSHGSQGHIDTSWQVETVVIGPRELILCPVLRLKISCFDCRLTNWAGPTTAPSGLFATSIFADQAHGSQGHIDTNWHIETVAYGAWELILCPCWGWKSDILNAVSQSEGVQHQHQQQWLWQAFLWIMHMGQKDTLTWIVKLKLFPSEPESWPCVQVYGWKQDILTAVSQIEGV